MVGIESKNILESLRLQPDEVIEDYRLAFRSRQVSLVGRREVMSGKAKFGIFGDGKELPQIAMAKVFKEGDFRSGYYRDQTFVFATGQMTVQQFFAQLYAHADLTAEPGMGGRAMTAHFATRSLNAGGSWKSMLESNHSAADISPTAAQMPRLVGLAYASKLYRQVPELRQFTQFSDEGNEVAFGTIGNASCAEGLFWEAANAIGVLGAPALITVYDDGYGISVSNEQQLIKTNLSELLNGFQRDAGICWGHDNCGYDIYTVAGWDYPNLVDVYRRAVEVLRREHVPTIIHVNELTQPQGHSTSGSHERYKSKERLEWEREYDGLRKLREWILAHEIATDEALDQLENDERKFVEDQRKKAWEAYTGPILEERKTLAGMIEAIARESVHSVDLQVIRENLFKLPGNLRRDMMATVREVLLLTRDEPSSARQSLVEWKNAVEVQAKDRYDSHLYSESAESPLKIAGIPANYSEKSPLVYGYEILNACFNAAMERDPRVIAFGEDVGRLGDVNQGMRGLQEKFGFLRITDTGIREATILGQAIGMAMRGLRPIAEIQYLDYLLYALQIMSDDLATLHWRTKGGQKAPVIVRTRGHRLEGIWHSGSPMAGIINLVRGVYVLVPRNMVQAAGFYNTLLRSDNPALVVEVLNGYRFKERLPDNLDKFTVPLGVPEVIRSGKDVTLVTYGACCRIVLEAADMLRKVGIEAEVVDVQTLLPFDLPGIILSSLKKTGRIIFVDEDVPGGTTAYMLQQVVESQGGYYWLDSAPRTITGKAHRPAYGSDGDYWSKPNVEQVFDAAYDLLNEADPKRYPGFSR